MDYLIHIRKTGTAAEFATKVGVARFLNIWIICVMSSI